MSEIEIAKWVVMTVMGIAVWFIKTTLTRLQDDVEMIKKDYLHKEDFKEFKIELRSMFDDLKKDIRSLNSKENK